MKEKTPRYIFRLTLILLLITAVVAALLGLVDYITSDRIAAAKQQKLEKAMSVVLEADSFESAQLPEGADATVAAAYTAQQGGEAVGYIVEVRPTGFGGELDLMVGVSADGTVSGVAVISHSETSGLGAIAAADSEAGRTFRSQFVGKNGTLAVTKDGGEIDALTGATVTSRAVVTGVNAALACAALMG